MCEVTHCSHGAPAQTKAHMLYPQDGHMRVEKRVPGCLTCRQTRTNDE